MRAPQYRYILDEDTKQYSQINMETGEVLKLSDVKDRSLALVDNGIEDGMLSKRFQVRMSISLKDKICELITEGLTLSAIARRDDMPSISCIYTHRTWDLDFDRAVRAAYKYRAENFHDMAIDTALSSIGTHKDAIPSIKLAVDTLKWAAEKNDPARYASKEIQQAHTGVQIVIDTGVGHVAISDVTINEQGEFLGFGGDNAQDIIRGSGGVDSASEPIELDKDRWKEVGGE